MDRVAHDGLQLPVVVQHRRQHAAVVAHPAVAVQHAVGQRRQHPPLAQRARQKILAQRHVLRMDEGAEIATDHLLHGVPEQLGPTG